MTVPRGAVVILTQNPIGRGVSNARWASIGGIQNNAIWKENDAKNPHSVHNEIVAWHIAQNLGLPIPHSFPFVTPDGRHVFLQLNFNGNGPLLPPLSPAECNAAVVENPLMSAKILASDMLLMNTDRHAGNLAFRTGSNGFFVIYDHGHAVFGAPGQDPAPRRFGRNDWLGCDGKPGARHSLLDHITNCNDLLAALTAVEELDDSVFATAMLAARAAGLSAADGNQGLNALKKRRDRIKKIAHSNRAEFRGISQWCLT